MNITQLSEHLKDIPQDTLVGYAKNPTGVVPQFLALAEIQRRQELQTPQNQAPASTVAQDVLSRAAPHKPPKCHHKWPKDSLKCSLKWLRLNKLKWMPSQRTSPE